MGGREEKKPLLQTASVTRDPFTPGLVRALAAMYPSGESPEGEAPDSLLEGDRRTLENGSYCSLPKGTICTKLDPWSEALWPGNPHLGVRNNPKIIRDWRFNMQAEDGPDLPQRPVQLASANLRALHLRIGTRQLVGGTRPSSAAAEQGDRLGKV
jgi:hypothetical protein